MEERCRRSSAHRPAFAGPSPSSLHRWLLSLPRAARRGRPAASQLSPPWPRSSAAPCSPKTRLASRVRHGRRDRASDRRADRRADIPLGPAPGGLGRPARGCGARLRRRQRRSVRRLGPRRHCRPRRRSRAPARARSRPRRTFTERDLRRSRPSRMHGPPSASARAGRPCRPRRRPGSGITSSRRTTRRTTTRTITTRRTPTPAPARARSR